MLAGCPAELQDAAYQVGRHVGIAFQVIDDVLDVVASTADMGKETAVDLKLGLATAPVLFASEEHPELNAMIARRFGEPGDVLRALELVADSNGIARARDLAREHSEEVWWPRRCGLSGDAY